MSAYLPQSIQGDEIFVASKWAQRLWGDITLIIRSSIANTGACHIMLTGGRSASQFYQACKNLPEILAGLDGVHFYFGDERCVACDHVDSNYQLAMNTLFLYGIPSGVEIHRIEAVSINPEAEAERYASLLPDVIDILLLSMGEDGHIASLFPYDPAVKMQNKSVVVVSGPKKPFQRITITPSVIRKARHVFVMALGEQKYLLYKRALSDPYEIDSIPARMVLDREWIFGD